LSQKNTPPKRADGFPEDAVINCEVVITSYFNEDGKLMYCCGIGGDPNLAQVLGLCELAKITVYQIYMEEEEDDGR
jgi:hypothetical protein